jgi:hypothetical protein
MANGMRTGVCSPKAYIAKHRYGVKSGEISILRGALFVAKSSLQNWSGLAWLLKFQYLSKNGGVWPGQLKSIPMFKG